MSMCTVDKKTECTGNNLGNNTSTKKIAKVLQKQHRHLNNNTTRLPKTTKSTKLLNERKRIQSKNHLSLNECKYLVEDENYITKQKINQQQKTTMHGYKLNTLNEQMPQKDIGSNEVNENKEFNSNISNTQNKCKDIVNNIGEKNEINKYECTIAHVNIGNESENLTDENNSIECMYNKNNNKVIKTDDNLKLRKEIETDSNKFDNVTRYQKEAKKNNKPRNTHYLPQFNLRLHKNKTIASERGRGSLDTARYPTNYQIIPNSAKTKMYKNKNQNLHIVMPPPPPAGTPLNSERRSFETNIQLSRSQEHFQKLRCDDVGNESDLSSMPDYSHINIRSQKSVSFCESNGFNCEEIPLTNAFPSILTNGKNISTTDSQHQLLIQNNDVNSCASEFNEKYILNDVTDLEKKVIPLYAFENPYHEEANEKVLKKNTIKQTTPNSRLTNRLLYDINNNNIGLQTINVPNDDVRDFQRLLNERDDFVKGCSKNRFYDNPNYSQPWKIFSQISDILTDEVITAVEKDFTIGVSKFVEDFIELETQI